MFISLKIKFFNFILFKILIRIRDFCLYLFDICGINDLFRFINRKKMVILLYHGISERSFSTQPKRYISKSIFKKQINYLREKKYKFITLTDWVNIVENRIKVKDRYIILTFDDGFKNIVEQAYPIMKKYDAKVVFMLFQALSEKKD